MKKLLALVLAVLMLASLAIASVSAEDELVKLETIIDDYGNRVMFAGGKIDAAPVVDGVISEGEYSITYVESVENGVLLEGDITSYFAHDDEWIYHAYTAKEAVPQIHSLQFYGQHHLTIDKINAGKWADRAAVAYGLQADGSIKKTFTNFVGSYTWDTDLFVEITRDEDTQMTTYELKIKKSNFVEDAAWLAAHLDEMTQFTYIKHLGNPNGAGDVWSRINYTAQEKLALVDMGVTANINWGFYTVDFGAKPDGYGATTTTEAPATTTTAKAQTTTAAATTTVAATTTAKAADATTTAAAEEKGGCGSTLAISALVMIPTLAGGAMLLKRRKED